MSEIFKQDEHIFKQDELAMIRRIDELGSEYRAKVVGICAELPDCTFYIVELVDSIPDAKWSHIIITEHCLDKIT